MSQENLEVANRAVDAVNQGNADAFVELTTADIDWRPAIASAAVGMGYRGHDAVRGYIGQLCENFDAVQTVFDEFRDIDGRVLAGGRFKGMGTGSDIPTDLPTWSLFEFRGGRISRIRGYFDHGKALRAAGLASV